MCVFCWFFFINNLKFLLRDFCDTWSVLLITSELPAPGFPGWGFPWSWNTPWSRTGFCKSELLQKHVLYSFLQHFLFFRSRNLSLFNHFVFSKYKLTEQIPRALQHFPNIFMQAAVIFFSKDLSWNILFKVAPTFTLIQNEAYWRKKNGRMAISPDIFLRQRCAIWKCVMLNMPHLLCTKCT